MRTLTFKRGVHPRESKEFSQHLAIEEIPVPPKVIIPLNQHTGAPLEPLVQKGDRVKTGQILADSEAFFAAPVHSSVTGVVKNVGNYPSPVSPFGLGVEIQTEAEEEFDFDPETNQDYLSLDREKIVDLIKAGGIVGLGGAAFPAAVKFSPPPGTIIDNVILNGCECEPYLTSDHRLMLEYPEKIITGFKIIMKAVNSKRGIIGIEDNKPDAIEKIHECLMGEPNIDVQPLKTKYPQGAEKMLINAIVGRRIPPGQLPFQVGVLVSNVGTAAAVYDAVVKKIPLYKRVITLTGDALSRSANLMVRIGTSFSYLFDHLGGFSNEVDKIIMGGPMMGVGQTDTEVGVIKATSGILVMQKQKRSKEYNCINCSECVYHCPMILVPTRIVRFAKAEIWERADEFGAMDCIECGCCAYVCPSKIPLVHWIRVAKARLTDKKKKPEK